jgi:hypothetical protein
MKKLLSIQVMINGEEKTQIINIDKIIRIYESNSKIYIELEAYTILETVEQNIFILLDRIYLL